MAEREASTSQPSCGVSTRNRTRQRSSRQAPGATVLTSPSNRLDEYFPPRKSQRLAAKNAKGVFKQARQRGGSPSASPLTGHLGSIPQEVRQFG